MPWFLGSNSESGLRQIPEGVLHKTSRTIFRVISALAIVAAITFSLVHLFRVNAITAGFIYLVAILIIATAGGLLEATFASISAMLCLNYFFLPPIGTLTISDPQNWVALFAFLATSLTASQLSDRLKRQKREAVDQQREMERLYTLSRAILLSEPTQSAAKQITHLIAQTFDFPVVALYDRVNGQTHLAGAEALPGSLHEIKNKLLEVASGSTFIEDKTAKFTVMPIRLGGEPTGSLAISGSHISDPALQSLVNLVAVGMEKARAQDAVNRAEVARQSEELKSTLLDAIAHEFKTPLTSIKAVTTDLLSDPANGLQQYRELIAIADEGANRLERLVTEAIQLARIEGGTFQLNRAVHFPSSLIAGALRQMKPSTEGREVRVLAGDDLPLVFVDSELIQMVIRNLVDNALKYSPPSSPITIAAQASKDAVIISVADEGPGIPEVEQQQIFEKFYRSIKQRNHIKGTGMGLAIAREIVRAHSGDLWVKSGPGKGSEFFFSLPISSKEKLT